MGFASSCPLLLGASYDEVAPEFFGWVVLGAEQAKLVPNTVRVDQGGKLFHGLVVGAEVLTLAVIEQPAVTAAGADNRVIDAKNS